MSVSVRFLATLRAILDAKYNEYLLLQSSGTKASRRQLSSLAATVISWLSNFRIGDKNRHPEEIISSELNSETLSTFYLKLMSPYLNHNWEVIAFREFLMGSLTRDELLFYLKVRFKLMKGNGIENEGAYMETYNVSYVDGLMLVR